MSFAQVRIHIKNIQNMSINVRFLLLKAEKPLLHWVGTPHKNDGKIDAIQIWEKPTVLRGY